jgi:Spy/CpxP family protein refolding chaperone
MLLSSGAARAGQQGEDRAKWWFSEWGRTELRLTDTQAQEIEEIFQSLLDRLRGEKALFDQENAALTKLMMEGASERAIGPAIDRVESARSAVNRTRTWMLVRMHRVLSPEQRLKLKERHDRWERDRRQPRGGGSPR